MGEEPKIACIIANYNNANYLEECVSSVLGQTVKVDEIIITDDASTDDSRNIINEMAARNQNIIPVFRQHNIGISQNRHKAILLAKAQLITTLDSDDFFYPTKIESEFNILKRTNSDVAFSDFVLIDKDGIEINRKSLEYFDEISSKDRIKMLIQRKRPIPRDMMFKKELYVKVGGFSEELNVYEDFDLKLRLLVNTGAHWAYSHAPGTAYRILPGGLSKAKPFNNMICLFRIVMNHSPVIINKIGLRGFMVSLFYLTIFHMKKGGSFLVK